MLDALQVPAKAMWARLPGIRKTNGGSKTHEGGRDLLHWKIRAREIARGLSCHALIDLLSAGIFHR
jgi:hypothetical protein